MYADVSVIVNHAKWRQLFMGTAAVVFVLVAAALLVMWRGSDAKLLSVQTSSMEPAIAAGDAVLVKPVDVDDLIPGDIISYHSPAGQGITITHRVVEVDRRRGTVTTQGDANASVDQPVDGRLVIGRVDRHLEEAGYLINSVRHPAGVALLVYLPALMIVRGEMRRLTEFFQPGYRHPVRASA
jgi:signal peptidase